MTNTPRKASSSAKRAAALAERKRRDADRLKSQLATARTELEKLPKMMARAETVARSEPGLEELTTPAVSEEIPPTELEQLAELAKRYRSARRVVKVLTEEADYAAARRRAAVEIADQRYETLRAHLDRMVGE